MYTEPGKTDGREGETSIGGREFWVGLEPAEGEDMMLDCRLESDWLLDCTKWLPKDELRTEDKSFYMSAEQRSEKHLNTLKH